MPSRSSSRPIARTHKTKATGPQIYTVEAAYNDLTQEAFAVWVRLLVASETTLRQGRRALANVTGYSVSRFNAILRELKLKGYVKIKSSPGLPTEVVIVSRLLAASARFVRVGFAC